MKNNIKLLIFDVNETLLDLTPLRDAINKAIGTSTAFDQWFALLLQYSLVETITDQFQGFGEIGKATLKMVAESQKTALKETEIDQLLALIKKLTPHEDVVPAMVKLRELGIPMVALTNGTLETAKEQLNFAKLDIYMDQIFSVESCRKYKPHPLTYESVLKEMKVDASEAMMVASHAWDITGAQRAGLQSCFIARKGKVGYPLEARPVISVNNLMEAVPKIIQI